MSKSLVPRQRTKLRRNSKWQRVDALLPARQQVQHMQRMRGLGYLAVIELRTINRLLAEREQLVLEVIETRMRQAEASGEPVESVEQAIYQLFEAFSERLTTLEEVAGQAITHLFTNTERR